MNTTIQETIGRSKQSALRNMALFPAGMLVGYLILIGYFKSRGGYRAVELEGGGGGADINVRIESIVV